MVRLKIAGKITPDMVILSLSFSAVTQSAKVNWPTSGPVVSHVAYGSIFGPHLQAIFVPGPKVWPRKPEVCQGKNYSSVAQGNQITVIWAKSWPRRQ